jgi:hypothetical protein
MSHPWFEAPWPDLACVRTAITTRGLDGASLPPYDRCNVGDRVGDVDANVQNNRTGLVARFGLPAAPLWLRQVHGIGVVNAERVAGDAAPEADASWTTRPGSVLVVQTADCLPLLVADQRGGCVAAIHAGWRGLAAGVIEATFAQLPVAASACRVFLGPAAGPRHYEVGEDVRATFVDAQAVMARAFVATRPGHWLCDLYTLARLRLGALGVARIDGGDRCTISEREAFYSHRRDGRTGRMASLIWIRP